MTINLADISSQQVTPEILSLFDITQPTMPRAFNVPERLNQGQILVDDPTQPTRAVVRDNIYGTLYFGGKWNGSIRESLLREFRRIGDCAKQNTPSVKLARKLGYRDEREYRYIQ